MGDLHYWPFIGEERRRREQKSDTTKRVLWTFSFRQSKRRHSMETKQMNFHSMKKQSLYMHFLALNAEKKAIMTGNAFLIFNESTY